MSNSGETTGRFTIRDYLPTGLTGNALEQSYDLAAGQTQMWTVDAIASGDVYDYIDDPLKDMSWLKVNISDPVRLYKTNKHKVQV